ncbi:anti-sigma factor [Sodalis sp. dw_96]|uniref:anti-sigma factor n=1 Tax=Sodalis sp. dw_96 TaxID=2719794 RepID=UPI001BD51C2A|nr:anti-sigma factor [Sodalis sp. dw_96]
MTQHPSAPTLTDELLVAYLDNELDADRRRQVEQQLSDYPQLAERLALLDRASLPFSAAYAGMLQQAPAARLQARLDGLASADNPSGVDRPASSGVSGKLTQAKPSDAGRGISRRNIIAATLAGLAVGSLGGRLSFGLFAPAGRQDNWRDLVAEYMSLYTDETFADTATSPDLRQRQLNTVGAKLGLTLDPGRLSLPGAELKFARLLSYDSQPIAQIAYLDERHGPLALCITRVGNGGREEDPESEVLRGMNVVYWTRGGHRYMLIGHNPATDLNALAKKLMAVS